MVESYDHGACVDAWMARVAAALPPGRQVEAFERAFAVLWTRAHRTLGGVTLTAIVDRVLYNATEQYPLLASVTVGATGLRGEALRESAGQLDPGPLADALRFVLTEFLRVIGALTSDILTPPLHAALCQVPGERGADGPAAPGETRTTAGQGDEDAQS